MTLPDWTSPAKNSSIRPDTTGIDLVKKVESSDKNNDQKNSDTNNKNNGKSKKDHKPSRKFLHRINAHELITNASRRTTASMARKIKLGEFFLRAKQWKDVAEFEAKELEKAKIYRSLRQIGRAHV